ncbi:Dipeptidyl peptidase 8 [Armadillidium nasatum]|uniref:Dipeptidyl peptidase 8 n=1 Tax=Armadillidium nasatum TaxID=96803 RepID=A0A5N5SSH3_9CRUS|nr:Dipeptidyl peptidase 8 [Armadillidium nasatum]
MKILILCLLTFEQIFYEEKLLKLRAYAAGGKDTIAVLVTHQAVIQAMLICLADLPMPRMNRPSTSGVLPRPTVAAGGGTLGWKEIHQRIRELRRTFVHLFVKTPTDITFRQLGPNLFRCYFLLSPGQGRESTLYYADINLDPNVNSRIVYQEVLDSTNPFLWRGTSKEEQLQSERRRISTWGITNYELHESSGTIVFPAASTIFQCIHPERPSGPTSFVELKSSKVRLNPQICPINPNIIAFTAKNDIYIYNTKSGEEKRATYIYCGNGRLEYDPKSAGVPSYVMQEEFSRFQGFWWQPLSHDGICRLLYEEVDESKVPIVKFISPDDSTGIDEFRFPRAGMANAESTLKLLEIESCNNEELRITTRHLRHDLKEIAPWHEYLVRVGWTPDGMHIWCQLLNRRQQHLELILLSLSSFTGGQHKNSLSPSPSYTYYPSFSPHCLVSLTSPVWIDVHNILYWFKKFTTDLSQKRLIFASEESGFRHLYLHTVQLSPPGGIANCYEMAAGMNDHTIVSAQLIDKRSITWGDWSVLTNGLWVDEKLGLVYFMGLKDSPIEQHLYVTSLTRPGLFQRLTLPDFSHQVFMNDDCSIFVSVFSNLETPSKSQVFRILPAPPNSEVLVIISSLGELVSEPLSEALLEIKPLVVPEICTTTLLSGETIYSMVFKPHNFVPGRKYPTVLHIYGGPQVQLVCNTFKGFRHMRTHMLAAHGFCVVSIDSRGSDNRGVEFQAHILNRLGQVEIEDQLEVLQYLAQKCDYLDLSRLAVFGWSYGGYLSLMALAQRPDFFKLAIAGAPVVSWNLYDTGYTERYMDLPSANPTGYRSGAVLNYVHNLPDQENRLLIVQGMIDENVHFSHTNKLIQSLIKHGKPYQLQIYPCERHCVRQLDSNEHYETKLLSFLLQNL